MVISCIWARADFDTDKRRANSEWLDAAIKRAMERLIRAKSLALPRFVFKEYTAEGATPSNDTKLYLLAFPTAEGHLALRQSALDEWAPKFARLKKDFDEMDEKHNKDFNPSGSPYKGEGQKLPAAAITHEDDQEGDPFPELHGLRFQLLHGFRDIRIFQTSSLWRPFLLYHDRVLGLRFAQGFLSQEFFPTKPLKQNAAIYSDMCELLLLQ